jgi:phage/plasmid primase-like uncharacterized protein
MSKLSSICRHEVKQKASGNWDSIIVKLAPSLASALERPGTHVDCPMHGGKMDFRVFRNVADTGGGVCTCGTYPDGFSLIGAANDWSFKDALAEVGRLILGDKSVLTPRAVQPRKHDTAKEDLAIRQGLSALWQGSIAPHASAAEPFRRYLSGRGLKWPQNIQGIRFHPSLAYYQDGILKGRHPGFIALVSAPDGTPVTIHRTYLTAEGKKAEVDAPKKLCPHPSDRPLMGAAIRLFAATDTLAVAEGIETALAVTEQTGIPCWATVTAGIMAEFIPPAGVEKVLIFADRDRPSKYHPEGHGQESARILAERLWKSGIKAGVRMPPMPIPDDKKGIDWLDCLVHKVVA